MNAEKRSFQLRVIDSLVERLLRSGIDGVGPLRSASSVAADARAATATEGEGERQRAGGRGSEGEGERQRAGGRGSDEDAVDKVIRRHVRLAALEGAVTGLGGFVTLVVALPANVWAFHLLAIRMVAAIAAIHGHDVSTAEVRTAVLLALAGDEARDILHRAGAMARQGRLTSIALRGLPPSALMAVNKGVVFRLLVQFSRSGLARFGKLVPGMGGVIGGAVDAYLMREIGQRARKDFARAAA